MARMIPKINGFPLLINPMVARWYSASRIQEVAILVVRYCLVYLLPSVHYKGTIPSDWLIDFWAG